MARILVTEKIADGGLQRLRDTGHVVDVRIGLTPDELIEVVHGAAGLIIRSATQVTREVLEAGRDLVVVGRAGIGLDNVDVETATDRGVMVVNAPQSNILSTAEHTMGMLLAQARNIPQAHEALTRGRWERSQWEGVELADKVLGIVGLGRVGRLVAQRAHAFGMRLVATDPYVSPERARQMNVELMSLEQLVQVADFVTLHVVKTSETIGMIDKDVLSQAKPGIRIVNVARGGIVDEDALAEAIRVGHVAGAALDVFSAEPMTDSPLFGLPQVVVTPHLGASTREAQDKAGDTIAEQVGLALAGEFVPFAVNVSAAEASEAVRHFLPLAERLGAIYTALAESLPKALEIEYAGQIADSDTRILTLSVLKGVFGGVTDEPVSYVNAHRIAAERGVEVRDTSTATAHDYVNLISISGGDHGIGGTLVGLRGEPRIVMLDGHTIDLPPASHMLVVRNDDRPGMIAHVAGVLAEAGVNIDDMHLGRSERGAAALQVIATDRSVPVEVQDVIRAGDGIVSVHAVG
ncbi:MAG TPA: phosphoglycerate dehydrogenase [Acidimicrobiales bacterium]|nr:phosphoglycerate dehydrogenase [Acidimicrobiales bacterium]